MIVPLAVHSNYSLLYGTIPPGLLVSEAKRLGYGTLGLADRNGLYGLPTFLEAADDEGLRPLVGLEVTYEGGSCLVFAKDRPGFSSMTRFLTARAGCLPGVDKAETGGKRPGPGERAGLAEWLAGEGTGLVALTDDPLLLSGWRGRGDRFSLLRRSARPSWKRLLALGVPPAAAAEISFLRKEDRAVQRLLIAIGKGMTVWDVAEGELSPEGATLDEPWSIEREYREFPEALEGNAAVAAACRFNRLFDGWRFPAWPTDHPGGSIGLLRDLVLEGAKERCGFLGGPILARIDYELAIIGEKNFADYFLVVRDIVRRASRTCGRGSAAASVVSWALGITAVDPLRHNLYFERFLNPGRKDPPDIDVDFAWDERDGLLEEVVSAYGEAHAARVANHIRFKRRGALRETARAFGVPDAEIGDHERRLSHDPAATAATLDGVWREVAVLAERITGFPRHLGVHSGGLVVVPGELCDIVPLGRSGGGIRITVWDKEGVEAAGLVKIDLLGNRSLAVVRDARANVATNSGDTGEGESPLDDAATIGLLARGDTMGVFYVESPAMRLLQKKTGLGDFEHLVIHSSMIRPAANRYINEYIDRLGGKEWKPLHPLLAGVLDEAEGLMCYQEDVSKVAVALAGFTPAEADGMRKVLSKKDAVTRLDSFKPKFAAGARERGVDEAVIEEVWAMIQSFAGYSFVKAHSASYALLSFQSAWLRAHHPAEFMAAVISNRGGYYSVLAYASEARRMGLVILPPSVAESGIRCRGGGAQLRFGLGLIAGLNEAAANRVVEERSRRGPWADIDDFGRRVAPDRGDAEALVGSGALDEVSPGLGRAEKLMRLLSRQAMAEHWMRESPGLFPVDGAGGLRTGTGDRDGKKRGRPVSQRSRLEAELRWLGTTLEVHPLALWPAALASRRVLAKDLPDHVGESVRLLGWPVTAKEVMAKGENPMEFVSFEDETALFEVVLFPDTYRRFGGLLFEERPFFIIGRVQLDRNAITLELRSLEKLDGGAGTRPGKSFYGRYW